MNITSRLAAIEKAMRERGIADAVPVIPHEDWMALPLAEMVALYVDVAKGRVEIETPPAEAAEFKRRMREAAEHIRGCGGYRRMTAKQKAEHYEMTR